MDGIFHQKYGGIPSSWTSHLRQGPFCSKFQLIHRIPNACIVSPVLNNFWYGESEGPLLCTSTIWDEGKRLWKTARIWFRRVPGPNWLDEKTLNLILMGQDVFFRGPLFYFDSPAHKFWGKLHMIFWQPHRGPTVKLTTTIFSGASNALPCN